MSHFTDVIKKMKRKKDEDEKTTVVGRRSMFNTIGLMKKASVLLKEKEEREKQEKMPRINVCGQDSGYLPSGYGGSFGGGANRGAAGATRKPKYDKAFSISMNELIPDEIKYKSNIRKKEMNRIFVDFDKKGKDKETIKSINESYALKQRHLEDVLSINAYCNIKFDESANCLMYNVFEPTLSPDDEKEIVKIKKYFEEMISIHFDGLRTTTAIEFVKKTLMSCIEKFGLNISKEKIELYKYYLFRDFIGLESVEPLLNDPHIEDISCDGINIPIFVFHRNPKYGSLQTNIVFKSKKQLDVFVMKLAQRCGKTVSVANPYFDGALNDGSRIQATLATDVATRGSNFTIRKFLKDPITPIFLLKYKTIDIYTLAYLWLLIEYNTSVLVVGGTASGKTSLLNALSLFIRPEQKIISIEDTAELQLSHPHWVAEVSREGFETVAGHEKKVGEVAMMDLLKEALRQRPDYILVGEVRGEEATILFQAMATGHSGMATIHADTMERLVDRITSKPLSIPVALLETLDMIVFIKRLRYKDNFVRRISNIYEIEGYDKPNNTILSRKTFEWDAVEDVISPKEESILLGNIYTQKGIDKETIQNEIKKRARVLGYMEKKNITYYKDVAKIINKYYIDSDALIDKIKSIEEGSE
ncbi:MAG: type II/IV secretion system ATPase subunit [Candidatus Aenigmarchaeota archaeon]|nr:type II/IV secretion system ATPase subunit [Candidatus Aenigmarchaeota archaeon]